MTRDERLAIKAEVAEQVALALRLLMNRLHVEGEFPWEAILAGCHAEVVTAMASRFGGKVAAEQAEQAANRVRHLPSLAEHRLANARPAGTA